MTDIREYLVDNMFDGHDGGRFTGDIPKLLDDIVENVTEWMNEGLAEGPTQGRAPDGGLLAGRTGAPAPTGDAAPFLPVASLIERLEAEAKHLESEAKSMDLDREELDYFDAKAEGVRLALSYIKEGGNG